MRYVTVERSGRGSVIELASRRRSPRVLFDVDWFVESLGCSALGRGLELNARGALLPLDCTGPFAHEVVLHVALPGRARMFRATGSATARAGKGWAIKFDKLPADEMRLLLRALENATEGEPANRSTQRADLAASDGSSFSIF